MLMQKFSCFYVFKIYFLKEMCKKLYYKNVACTVSGKVHLCILPNPKGRILVSCVFFFLSFFPDRIVLVSLLL